MNTAATELNYCYYAECDAEDIANRENVPTKKKKTKKKKKTNAVE